MRAWIVALLLVSPTLALADDGFYVGIGGGSNAKVSDGLGDAYSSKNHKAHRFVLGRRMGPWAIEANVVGTDLTDLNRPVGNDKFGTASLGAALKYYLPITSSLELYVRGGLNETWLGERVSVGADHAFQGRGYDYGTGVQYAFRLGQAQAALWLDLNSQAFRLHKDGQDSIDGKVQMLTLGVSIGTGL